MFPLENSGEFIKSQPERSVQKEPRPPCPKLQQTARVVLPKLSDDDIAKYKNHIRDPHRSERNRRISGFKKAGEGASVDDSTASCSWMTSNLKNDGADASLGQLQLRKKYKRTCILERCRVIFMDTMAKLNHLETDHLENNVPVMKEGVCAQIRGRKFDQISNDDADLGEQMETDAYLIPGELAGKIDPQDWAKRRDKIRELSVIKQLLENMGEEAETANIKGKLKMLSQIAEEKLKAHFQVMKEEIEAKSSRKI